MLDAANYEKLTAHPDFFTTYQGKKDKVNSLMEQWERLQD